MNVDPPRPSSAGPAAPAAESGETELIEVTFIPAEPQLTPGAARAVLALLLHARDRTHQKAADLKSAGQSR